MPITKDGRILIFGRGTLPIGGASPGDVAAVSAEVAALRDEARDGRVWGISGSETPSGLNVPSWANLVQTVHNASGTSRDWRPVGPPSTGLETADLVKDGNPQPRWWARVADTAYRDRATHTGQQPMATIEGLGAALTDAEAARVAGDNQLRAVARDGVTIPLINIGGTPDAITADIWPSFLTAGITTISDTAEVVFNPNAPNVTGSPTLTAGGVTLTIRDVNNNTVPASFLRPGRPYKGRRSGSNLRIVAGDATSVELAGLRADRIVGDAQGGTITLDSVGGTGDAITASVASSLTAIGISAANVRRVTWTQPATNTAERPTLNIDGMGAVPIFSSDNAVLPAGGLKRLRIYEAVKVAGRWILISDVNGADLKILTDTQTAQGARVAMTEQQITALRGTVWPGDGLTLVRATNGPVLMVTPDGTTRGRFLAEDVVGLEDGTGGSGGVDFLPPDTGDIPMNAFNIWQKAEDVLGFLSDDWMGRTIAFEKRGGRILAETPSLAIGVLAFGGGGLGIERPLVQRHRYHVLSETGGLAPALIAADAAAVMDLDLAMDKGRKRRTLLAASVPQASITEAEALPDTPKRQEFTAKLADLTATSAAFGKTLFVDRILLSLLEGSPNTHEKTADAHYAAVGNGLRMEVAGATDQGALPLLVVSQSAGTRTSGGAEVILAEARLDWTHFALNFVVATPKYPFALAEGMPATHTTAALRQISEMEALAVAEVHAGNRWYCPVMEEVTKSNARTLQARFNALSNLALDAGEHGFTVLVNGTPVAITSAAVSSGTFVNLTLATDLPASAEIEVRYAWGASGDRGDGFAANRGKLRDGWGQVSRYDPAVTLRRYALSARVRFTAA
ncbi:SwmB domain-containing protein [Falsirhodobacter halotolerans]|uniref:SwmB domain-containing protein n=1 Tax=Falsirhodobacter halotolerans TaxID=1146892 RepID=UPI001FD0D646|nr:SwmB domain-containing protein [Falsirhodobacter halotolerans]MCJ8139556.1 hypothetical protein [Falsirhodobacter halotolerans]